MFAGCLLHASTCDRRWTAPEEVTEPSVKQPPQAATRPAGPLRIATEEHRRPSGFSLGNMKG